MNIDYTELLQAIIALLATLITTFLIPFIKKKLSAEKVEELRKWVEIAVHAAEQLYGSKTGQQKKKYVVAFLESKGIKFDADAIDVMIEAEVQKILK